MYGSSNTTANTTNASGRDPLQSSRSQPATAPQLVLAVHPKKFDYAHESRSPDPGILPPDVIEDGIYMYLEHFHAQPYALLCQANTAMTAASISPVVLNPMLALSIRCSSHPFWTDTPKRRSWLQHLTDRAWKDLLQLYGDGDTGLEYLQGLCLLAQVDFADGRVKRAHSQLSLGIRIAQSSGYLTNAGPNDTKTEEIVRCTWTLFMLDRTFSITRLVSPALPYQHFQLRKPISERRLSRGATGQKAATNVPAASDQDLGALIVEVYSIWDDVLKYVFQTSSDNTMPPWQPGSELATIEYRFADYEPQFSTHRYREVDFPRKAINEPRLRPYFASWLCFQLTYMSIQCVVHHPFIMFIKLQHVIRKVPPSFLQKSYKSSLIHSRWIIRFLDEMDEAGMMLYDPFIGFLTAIAATIQLEHTLSKHSDIATAAKLSFRNAIRFLKKLAKYWNSIQELLGIVEELAARLRHRRTLYYSQDDYDGILPAVESERVGLAEDDAKLMWKVFDYASMSASKSNRVSDIVNKAIDHDQAEHLPRAQHQPPITQNAPTSQQFAQNPYENSLNGEFQGVQIPPVEENLDLPNSALFNELPEDWAFTIDDWTLFGEPGSTHSSLSQTVPQLEPQGNSPLKAVPSRQLLRKNSIQDHACRLRRILFPILLEQTLGNITPPTDRNHNPHPRPLLIVHPSAQRPSQVTVVDRRERSPTRNLHKQILVIGKPDRPHRSFRITKYNTAHIILLRKFVRTFCNAHDAERGSYTGDSRKRDVSPFPQAGVQAIRALGFHRQDSRSRTLGVSLNSGLNPRKQTSAAHTAYHAIEALVSHLLVHFLEHRRSPFPNHGVIEGRDVKAIWVLGQQLVDHRAELPDFRYQERGRRDWDDDGSAQVH
ncbi:hypothetical protein LAWI1_G004693 [Lachnellula willkommii]|uniref:Xylanolytic transcriptional activator regulatory domain-containing protein n=1 Tax=Lachnellula willkommii TaxID=215461 RepID=A0A559ME63_9HELO|nr:hypothetical protein LAWI1_G004693 [Lachnellula willkommii]